MSLPSRPIETALAVEAERPSRSRRRAAAARSRSSRAAACSPSSTCLRCRARRRAAAPGATESTCSPTRIVRAGLELDGAADAHVDAVERAFVAHDELAVRVEEVRVGRRQERIVGERDRTLAATREVIGAGERERHAVLAVAADQRQLRARLLHRAAEEHRAAAGLRLRGSRAASADRHAADRRASRRRSRARTRHACAADRAELEVRRDVVPHFVHGVGARCRLDAAAACASLTRFGRGSSATGCPQRAHCGTPIGVNALHASQTRPTSIACDSTPLRNGASKNGGRQIGLIANVSAARAPG